MLRPSAYSLRGPGSLRVVEVLEDLADLTKLELQLSGPMPAGAWSLTVSDVRSPAATALSSQSVDFSYPYGPPPSPKTPSGYNVVAQAIGPTLIGPTWDALKKTLGWCAQMDLDYAEFCLSQLFVSTATDRWLTKRAAEIGLARSAVSGISDDRFRYLTVSYWWGKLVQPGLLSMLDAYWGPDMTRAVAVSGLREPFRVFGGEDLVVRVGSRSHQIVIPAGSLSTPGVATAAELAAALSAASQKIGAPMYFESYRTGAETALRAITRGMGLEAKLAFLGGSAQPVLQFPVKIQAFTIGLQPTWSISEVPADAAMQMTCVDPTGEDLSKVHPGDYACIYGTEFLPSNRGTFEVLSVDITILAGIRTQKIRLANRSAINQVVGQLQEDSALFFRPSPINQIPGGPLLTQAAGGLSVVLPTTSLVVDRNLLTAGYPQDGPVVIASASKVDGLVTFIAPGHDVVVGETIDVGAAIPSYVDAQVFAGGGALSDYSARSIWSAAPPMSVSRQDHVVVGLASGAALAVGGWDGASYLASAEIFSVSSELSQPGGGRQLTSGWAAAAPRPVAASRAVGIRLPTTDTVLVAGGFDGVARQEAQLYDELTNSWLAIPDMPGPSYWAAIAIPIDGESAWIFGGHDGVAPTASTYRYDLASNAWTTEPSMIAERYRHAGIAFEGLILTCGGLDSLGQPAGSSETFDTSSPGWVAAGNLAWARYGHSLIQVGNGLVAAVGGLGRPADDASAPIGPVSEVEIFDFARRSWTSGGKLSAPVGLGAAGACFGRLFAFSGGSNRTSYREAGGAWRQSAAGASAAASPACYFSPTWAMACGDTPPSVATSVLIPNREVTQGRGIERFVKVEAADATTFSVSETMPLFEVSSWPSVEVRRSYVSDPRPGPYIFSPRSGEVGTGAPVVLTQDVAAGTSYSTLGVSGPLPIEAQWLAFDLGGPTESPPLRYLGPSLPGSIRVDFVAAGSWPAGTSVVALWANGPYSPAPGTQRVYCAPSDAPTIEAKNLMLEVSGGGLPRNVEIRYPSDVGMGGEGYPTTGDGKKSDSVVVWSGK